MITHETLGATRGVRLRTIIIPLSMILIHLLVIDLVASLYAKSYPWLSSMFHWTNNMAGQPYANAQELILSEYPRISVFYGLILTFLYSLILFFRRLNRKDSLWVKRPSGRNLSTATVLAVGLLGATNLLFSGLISIGEQWPIIGNLMDEYIKQAQAFSSAIGYGWLIAGISVMAPLSEELLFRGIIQGELRRAVPEWLAVVIQAVLFALFHMQAIQVLYVLLPALALGAMYALTRSIWVPILMHMVFNFFGSVVPSMVSGDDRLSQLVVWVEIGFAVFSIGIFFHLIRQRNRV